jgi:hypothetical protein
MIAARPFVLVLPAELFGSAVDRMLLVAVVGTTCSSWWPDVFSSSCQHVVSRRAVGMIHSAEDVHRVARLDAVVVRSAVVEAGARGAQ